MTDAGNEKKLIKFENKGPLFFVVAIAVLLLAYGLFAMTERRTLSEKVTDAYNELPNGVDKAARQLEDRTPAQKLGDAMQDAGNKINEKADQ